MLPSTVRSFVYFEGSSHGATSVLIPFKPLKRLFTAATLLRQSSIPAPLAAETLPWLTCCQSYKWEYLGASERKQTSCRRQTETLEVVRRFAHIGAAALNVFNQFAICTVVSLLGFPISSLSKRNNLNQEATHKIFVQKVMLQPASNGNLQSSSLPRHDADAFAGSKESTRLARSRSAAPPRPGAGAGSCRPPAARRPAEKGASAPRFYGWLLISWHSGGTGGAIFLGKNLFSDSKVAGLYNTVKGICQGLCFPSGSLTFCCGSRSTKRESQRTFTCTDSAHLSG